jgi:uncharacterized membrane protein
MNQTPVQPRHLVVDFARVLAIILMVQGHTLDVLLAPAYRQGTFFELWLFFRGLTAPTFFVLSGISFTLATMRRWDSYLGFSAPLFKRLRRYVFFICLGYVMHIPVRTYHDIRWLDTLGWLSWFQVDVLQCIGVTLAALQLLILIARTPARFAKIAVGFGAAIVLLAPIVWGIGWNRYLPLWVSSYFSGQDGSLFPLFPWSGYVFFGVGLGYLYAQRTMNAAPLPLRPLAWGGALLLLGGLCLQRIPLTLYVNIDFWKTSPNLFLIRIGCICLLFTILAATVRKLPIPAQATHALARESLTIYFVHICILYGSLWNSGLRHTVGATLAPGHTLLVIALMLASMLTLGWTWSWFKRAEPMRSTLVRAAIALAVAYSLV